MNLVKRAIVFGLAIVLILGGGVAFLLNKSYQGSQGETFIRVEKGSTAKEIADTLVQAGVVQYRWQFLLQRALRRGSILQAGEYRFAEPGSVREVFDKLARGDVYYVEFTVPEGNNMFDIAHSLESAGILSTSDFLHAASDPKLIQDIAPEARTLEGYLFPATYRLSHWITPEEICRQMTDQFKKQWKRISAGKGTEVRQADVHQVVTLASLIEKETGVASERPLVAGVFENRLRIGMPLGCDPTTIYAALLENRYRDVIHRSDLASRNPYNTYQHPGLPPGPIANPGSNAISAALAPAQTKYLYFVAKPEGGGHQFSTNLAEHEKATREYRRGTGSAAKKVRKAG